MIIKTEDFKEVSKNLFLALGSGDNSFLSDTLELVLINDRLDMYVTNREYFVTVGFKVSSSEPFKATINANLFLKLVSQTTTDTIELLIDENTLIFKGNGTYKIPMIFEGNNILELPKIKVNNITSEFNIDSSILNNILKYNLKQLSIGTISRPVQKLFYVDENGAITFTSGACVYNFNLEKPVKLLFNQRIVKLFKLFKSGDVHFMLGHESISDDIMTTTIKLFNDEVELDAVLSYDDTILNSIPVTNIRGRANKVFPYSAVIDKNDLSSALNRIKLMINSNSTSATIAKFIFNKNSVTVSDKSSDNREKVNYLNELIDIDEYEAELDIDDLLSIIDTCQEKQIALSFGDHQAMVLSRLNVLNVLPEIVE